MGTWIEFDLIEYQAHDKRTGSEEIAGIPTRFIQPSGRRYPEIPVGLHVLSWQQKSPVLMLLVEGDEIDITKAKSQAGEREVTLSETKTLRYDISSHTPQELTKEQALSDLKSKISLPEDTTLDADGKPIISEARNEAL